MSDPLLKQKDYWNRAIDHFDSIYSHEKSFIGNLVDRLVRWDMYKRFQYTMDKAEPISGRTFLDVGFGTGRYSLEFIARGARFVVGIDVSDKMIETCRERAMKMGAADRTGFLLTDLMQYNPDRQFDVCIGIGLFDYIRDPLPVIEKMRATVTGKVIMSFPLLWTWKAPVRKVQLGLKGCDSFFYTKGQVMALVMEAGFRDFTIEKIGQLYCVTAMR